MNKTATISIAILAIIYIALTIFPLKAVYKINSLTAEPYDSKKPVLVEVGKKFVLLPGPKTIWAMRTPSGYDFYRGLPSPKKSNKPLFTIK